MSAPYRHIAVCVDDSPGSDRALEEAVRLRALGQGRLSVVHAAPWPLAAGVGAGFLPDIQPVFDAEQEWLRRRVADIEGVEPVFLIGYAPWVIREWAASSGCDLLVASAHRGAFARMALGSFAATLAYHAPCAVLLVRPPIVVDTLAELERAAAKTT
jgi:nucleotide-binding universal stress UspA family protein